MTPTRTDAAPHRQHIHEAFGGGGRHHQTCNVIRCASTVISVFAIHCQSLLATDDRWETRMDINRSVNGQMSEHKMTPTPLPANTS
eukprot:scaffold41091_cov21-Cyclotella_meneghiniana.AAC.3